MADDPMTKEQGREIIGLLKDAVSALESIQENTDTIRNIESSLEAIQKDVFDMELRLRSIERNQK